MHSNYEQIADEHRQGYGSFDHHLEGYEDFYSDDTHFLYELIQNAQDAIATAPSKNRRKRFLRITLRDNDLVAVNDGLPFAERHVRAICSVRQSTKDLGQIGAHGIGFKSVGKFTSSPEIYSRDERFRIHRRVEPQLIEEVPSAFKALLDEGCTVFRLPFKADIRPTDLDRLGERLPHIHKWALLFLHDLRRVEWQDERSGRTGRHRCYRKPHPTIPYATIVCVRSEMDGEVQAEETFLCFSRNRQPPPEIVAELCRQAKTEKERISILGSRDIPQPVEVAFAFREGDIAPLDGGLLFSFLPTRKETHLRFLLQAHYKTTFARDDIHDLENSPWNRWLVNETAAFIPDILHSLKEAGLWTPRAFAVLPAPRDDVPDGEGRESIFQPVLAATLKALAEGKLIPTAKRGHFAGPTRVFQPHTAALRRLVSGAQLVEITGVQGAKWLDPDLYWSGGIEQILRKCGVKEVSASQVVSWLETKDADWFEARDDDWLREAYVYLGSQPVRGEKARIKAMPLARQADGKHVCADVDWVFFQPEDDEQRQAIAPIIDHLPALKMSLISGEARDQIKSFLTGIGVETLDTAKLLGKWFLPKYGNGEQFTPEENRNHVGFVVNALGGLSQSEVKALQNDIQNIPFLWCRKEAGRGITGYATPNQAYLPAAFTGSGDLETYFGESPEHWLVDESYLDSSEERVRWLDAMKTFGVAILPRRLRNPSDTLSYAEKRLRWSGIGHTEDIATKDWLLEGLLGALTRIRERRPDAHATSVALWRLLAHKLPQDEAKRKEFFYGTYIWKYRIEREAAFPATFYKALTETAWVPVQGGGFRTPQDQALFTPDADTRRVLGARVEYLHSDLGVGEHTSQSRVLAEALGIKLGADIATVLTHLEAMSGHAADVTEISSMYQFLLSRGMTGRKDLFAEKALIYAPTPVARWWKSGDVFWSNESAAFAETRGYLKPHYPALKTFFTSVDVPESAAFRDYARAVLEVAAERTITVDLRRRAHYLYQRLWATASVLETKTEEPAAQAALWQRLRDAECWLGNSEDAWDWHRRTELLLNDHDFRTELFSPYLPLWPYADLDALAHFLEVTPASLARPAFIPFGEEEAREDWTDKVYGLKENLACFFASPRLAPESPVPSVLDILDNLSVVVVEGAEMTYTTRGVTVTDPQPPPSDLEVQDGQATLWITREAEEGEYPLVIGEALEEHFGVRQLGAFASELLGTGDNGRVLVRWQKKGLRYESPAVNLGEGGYGQEEGHSQVEGDTDTNASGTNESGADNQEFGEKGNGGGPNNGDGEQDGDENDEAEDSTDRFEDTGQGSHGGRRHGGGGRGGSGSGGRGGGGGPETDSHKGLKNKIRNDPSLIALGLNFIDEEYDIASGQAGSIIDILLKDAEGRFVIVEVKPHVDQGEYKVVWQAVRYKHLLAVENEVGCEDVRSFLVAPELPQDIKLKCDLMGIEYREITP